MRLRRNRTNIHSGDAEKDKKGGGICWRHEGVGAGATGYREIIAARIETGRTVTQRATLRSHVGHAFSLPEFGDSDEATLLR
jgi:hypothetical protein